MRPCSAPVCSNQLIPSYREAESGREKEFKITVSSYIGPKSYSEGDKKSGSCLILGTIAFIWGNKSFPLPHGLCYRMSSMTAKPVSPHL